MRTSAHQPWRCRGALLAIALLLLLGACALVHAQDRAAEEEGMAADKADQDASLAAAQSEMDEAISSKTAAEGVRYLISSRFVFLTSHVFDSINLCVSFHCIDIFFHHEIESIHVSPCLTIHTPPLLSPARTGSRRRRPDGQR